MVRRNESFTAQTTAVGLLTRMNSLVNSQVGGMCKCLTALTAGIRLASIVLLEMDPQTASVGEPLVTLSALVGLGTSVNVMMLLQ
jgi:hypothetical protein